jgi:DNA repair protein RadC
METYSPRSIKTWALEDRPREKLFQRGIDALTDAELLALIFGTGHRDLSAIDLGRQLLSEFGGLQGMAQAPLKDLMRVKGIGRAKAVSLAACFELGRRKSSQVGKEKKMNSAEAVYQYLGPGLADLDHEVFCVLFLNRNHELKAEKQLFEGGVNATVIDTRIIFREAVNHLASSIILVHNHPSGNLNPSQPDRNITRKCQEAGKLFDIPVLDHVIISSRGYYSFANSGEM